MSENREKTSNTFKTVFTLKLPYFQQEFSLEPLNIQNISKDEIDSIKGDIISEVVKMDSKMKMAWLLKAVTFIDLTTLKGTDTPKTIEELCLTAIKPFKSDISLEQSLSTAAVCVYPLRVSDAFFVLQNIDPNNRIKIASVAAGFPSGQYPLSTRLSEIHAAIKNGADEIDVVINRTLVLEHNWEKLYNEICAMSNVCRMYKEKIYLKTILATGELPSFQDIYKASMIAMMAGSDFIKTSTGNEAVNATLPAGIIMCKAILDYFNWTGRKVGFKPAGGIKTATQILQWITLVQSQLGSEWLTKDLFRIGASSVLDDLISTINSLKVLTYPMVSDQY